MEPLFRLTLMCILLVAAGPLCAERIHFLIPGGAGGGWDSTARGVGEALARSGLIEAASYENMSGGAGSRALSHLIETADRQTHTLMVSSSPIILRSLRKVFPQSYHDVTPVASVIVDYGAFVVRRDSAYQSWRDVVADFMAHPRRVNIAGGSARGSTDHLVAALAFQKSGADPRQVKYIPYNAGGHAMVGLLSGETQLLSTGLSEAIALADQGEVRILAVTAPERLDRTPEVPTLVEQGVPAVFANWRGFFAAPGISAERVAAYADMLARMYETDAWQRIRDARGWTDFYVSGADFAAFLEQQERDMADLLRELSMLP